MRHSDNSEAVRQMVAADLPDLVALWIAAWQETMPEIDFTARRAWITAFLGEPRHRTLVAAGPTGFVSLEDAYLHQLVVAPAAKGTGIARRLLEAAKAEAPAGLTLDVNQANARAIRFYEREGFVRAAAGVNPTSNLPTWRLRWRP